MKFIDNVVRGSKKIAVYFATKEEIIAAGIKANSLAFAGVNDKLGRHIIITELYEALSKDTRSVIFEHEVAHALGIHDEVSADKRAILIYGKEKYIAAIKESYALMREKSTRLYSNKEFNDIVSGRISLAIN